MLPPKIHLCVYMYTCMCHRWQCLSRIFHCTWILQAADDYARACLPITKLENLAIVTTLRLQAWPPKPRQPFPALITTLCRDWSRWTYPLPYYSVFAADTLLQTVTLTSDPVTLTFNFWPWTFAYLLWCDEILYQIWTQSSNPRRSYCDFNVWPYDLEHCVTCCTRLWDHFHKVWP